MITIQTKNIYTYTHMDVKKCLDLNALNMNVNAYICMKIHIHIIRALVTSRIFFLTKYTHHENISNTFGWAQIFSYLLVHIFFLDGNSACCFRLSAIIYFSFRIIV